jgi:asparagine synthase (glutamine-hydrolysing)
MCGIAGFFDCRLSEDQANNLLNEMSRVLSHRGPDGQGSFFSKSLAVGLSHSRLSIVDLTASGSQPMESISGRYHIVYNGEVYNHIQLGDELRRHGYKFRGTSDTEVILGAIEVWGLEAALHKFVGMFAFALLDQDQRSLYLVRDRIGEKPIYFGWQGEVFLFGSELKALKLHPAWQGELNGRAISDLIALGYVPCGRSIYADIEKLPPGKILRLNLRTGKKNLEVSEWWSLPKAIDLSRETGFTGGESDAVRLLVEQLRSTIRDQLVADVPVGTLLSGGIDSSIVTAIAQEQSTKSIETFTIGFNDKSFDESGHAKRIASHLGTEHHEWIITPDEVSSVIPALPDCFDEPFADSSQVPTFLVFKMASTQAKVVLTGDGGDEVFGGYNRHYLGPRIFERIDRVPPVVRRIVSTILRSFPPSAWRRLLATPFIDWFNSDSVSVSVEKIEKIISLLSATTQQEFYRRLVREGDISVLRDAALNDGAEEDLLTEGISRHFTERMMLADMLTYLPGDILVKVDRASMANSIESRAPLLDHRIISFASRLPLDFKVRPGGGKHILKEALTMFVPPELTERPKAGFAVPISEWLRGPLRDWCSDLLRAESISAGGIFRPDRVTVLLADHLSCRQNNAVTLWRLLMFQSWLEKHRSNATGKL